MSRVARALGGSALIAVAAIAAAGMSGAGERFARESSAAPVAALRLDHSLAPAVVIATRPTLREILDIVLRERPPAARLAGTARTGSFPEGSDEAHIASVLSRYNADRSLVNRVAAAIVSESRRRNIGSSLLVGVLLTENPALDPRATSFMGARGLMQVMPFHAGKWGCGSVDLFDVESNICHGVAVLADNLGRSKTLPQALLGYNGCVRGKNTPDCWRYPAKVYRGARKTSDRSDPVQPFTAPAIRGRRSLASDGKGQ